MYSYIFCISLASLVFVSSIYWLYNYNQLLTDMYRCVVKAPVPPKRPKMRKPSADIYHPTLTTDETINNKKEK